MVLIKILNYLFGFSQKSKLSLGCLKGKQKDYTLYF
jgi:hypothetical protein